MDRLRVCCKLLVDPLLEAISHWLGLPGRTRGLQFRLRLRNRKKKQGLRAHRAGVFEQLPMVRGDASMVSVQG